MAREPRDYGPLKKAHQNAQDAHDREAEQAREAAHTRNNEDPAPTRPADRPVHHPVWTSEGGRVPQETSARESLKAKDALRRKENAAEATKREAGLHGRFPGLTREEGGRTGERTDEHERDAGRDRTQ